jgi:hypothetical protein
MLHFYYSKKSFIRCSKTPDRQRAFSAIAGFAFILRIILLSLFSVADRTLLITPQLTESAGC